MHVLSIKMGFLDSFKKIVGAQSTEEALSVDNDKQLKLYVQTVEKINALEEVYEKLSDEQLQAKTQEFRRQIKNGANIDSLLIDAFAVVREASWRTLELRHYDVQVSLLRNLGYSLYSITSPTERTNYSCGCCIALKCIYIFISFSEFFIHLISIFFINLAHRWDGSVRRETR